MDAAPVSPIMYLTLKTWCILVPVAIGSAACFEHIRYIITHRHRNNRLKDFWEPIDQVQQIPLGFWTTLCDYLFLPFTYTIGWFYPNSTVTWKQKFFHSLVVAGRFVNPFIEWQDRNTTDLFAYIKWQVTRNNRNGVPLDPKELDKTLPLMKPKFELLFQNSVKISKSELSESWVMEKFNTYNSMTVTWIGQSTCFVQMDGYNILTDPIFCSRTMGEWFGPKRLQPAPCLLSELPPIDIVLISHNHYDHLDLNTMQEIGNSATWYVPMGLKSWLAGYGIINVVELDWWQEYQHDENLRVAGLPIQHWSGRHFFDVNLSLWASFLVKTDQNSFFHCGDTGYCTAFKEIGEKYGPITFAALPIGSYEPRYFMCHQHMSPEEACQVHMDIRAKKSIGVHWGTFMMSDEHYLDPPKEFENARIKLNLAKGSCFTTKLGETLVLDE